MNGKPSPSRHGPRWFPGRELAADDLHAFEDFLSLRAALLDGGGPAVTNLDFTRIRFDEGSIVVSGPVQGVAIGEAPIYLSDSQQLTCIMPKQDFDLVIEINRSNQEGKSSDDKLKLTTYTQNVSHPIGALLIGRYDMHQQLVGRPWVRTFGSLKPLEGQREWLKPIAEKLEGLLKEARLHRLEPWAIEVARLAAEWLILPVRDVAFRLGVLYWLRNKYANETAIPWNPYYPTHSKGLTPDELPQWVADQYKDLPRDRRLISTQLVTNWPDLSITVPEGCREPFRLVVRVTALSPPSGKMNLRVGNGRIALESEPGVERPPFAEYVFPVVGTGNSEESVIQPGEHVYLTLAEETFDLKTAPELFEEV